MKRQEFIQNLKESLEKRNINNVKDILADYEEHFSHGQQKGQTEDEISAKLGNPATIAQAYETDLLIEQVKNPEQRFQWQLAMRVIGRMIIIAPFNLIILFIPGVISLSLLFAGWAVVLVFPAVGVAILTLAFHYGFWATLTSLSASLGVLGLGVLSGTIMFILTKYVLLAIINFFQWNLKFILEK